MHGNYNTLYIVPYLLIQPEFKTIHIIMYNRYISFEKLRTLVNVLNRGNTICDIQFLGRAKVRMHKPKSDLYHQLSFTKRDENKVKVREKLSFVYTNVVNMTRKDLLTTPLPYLFKYIAERVVDGIKSYDSCFIGYID